MPPLFQLPHSLSENSPSFTKCAWASQRQCAASCAAASLRDMRHCVLQRTMQLSRYLDLHRIRVGVMCTVPVATCETGRAGTPRPPASAPTPRATPPPCSGSASLSCSRPPPPYSACACSASRARSSFSIKVTVCRKATELQRCPVTLRSQGFNLCMSFCCLCA